MKLTLDEAYSILKLPYGASPIEVVSQYKLLASQYHINNALKKFQLASCAYKRITSPSNSDQIDMDMETMKDLFKNIIFGSADLSNGNGLHDDDSYSSDFSDDEYNSISQQNRQKSEQLAKELISEEEKEKRKAEKRRAKKKKRREKKKQEKEQEHIANSGGAGDVKHETANGVRSSDEGEGIDPNAAFVKKNKKKRTDAPVAASGQSKNDNNNTLAPTSLSKTKSDSSDPGENGSSKAKSRLVANKGNEAAHNGDYPAAIQQFTEAIKLEPTDYRFYGNRSYCYDRIMQFDKAMSDADKCIELAAEWPKGYFRKGRALAGLKLFSDAEKAFMQVLKLDRTCEEASKELTRVRTQQLIDMGFSPKQSEQAVLSKNSLQQALDYLLAGVGAEMGIGADDVYLSDDAESDSGELSPAATSSSAHTTHHHNNTQQPHHNNTQQPTTRASRAKTKHVSGGHSSTVVAAGGDTHLTEEKKMDPTNPEGLTALWVGNVLPTVKEADLQNLFNRYGHVSSVRCLPEKYCAFVNFKSKEAAGKAMNALQNHEVQGQNLLIKFPDNPIANGLPVTKLVKPPPQAPPQPIQKPEKQQQQREKNPSGGLSAQQKVSGPVNGDECYFWRTTGCQFGSKCRWRHVNESKGIDKKPWQRVK